MSSSSDCLSMTTAIDMQHSLLQYPCDSPTLIDFIRSWIKEVLDPQSGALPLTSSPSQQPLKVRGSPLVGNHRLGIVYNNKRFPRRIIICLLERVHSYLIITLWSINSRVQPVILGPHYQRQLISPNRPEQEKEPKGKTWRKKQRPKEIGIFWDSWRNWYKPLLNPTQRNSLSTHRINHPRLNPLYSQLNLHNHLHTQCIVNITPVISPSPPHGTRPTKTMKEVAKQAHAPNAAAKAWPSTKQENYGNACLSYNLDTDVIILRG